MLTVHEVSKLSGVSIRTLHHYDKIGLLHPTEHSRSGYRLYDDAALERLQQILLFRELEFPLKEIKVILDGENLDKEEILDQQIEMLILKKEHLEKLIDLAKIQEYIIEHFYICTDQIFQGLGQMYGCGANLQKILIKLLEKEPQSLRQRQ